MRRYTAGFNGNPPDLSYRLANGVANIWPDSTGAWRSMWPT